MSLYSVKWFRVLLYNSHNLTSVIYLHTICSIWLIDRALSGATTPGQSDNEEVLHISQIPKAGASRSDGLMSYPGHSWGTYSSAEIQSVYFTALVDWACFYQTNFPCWSLFTGLVWFGCVA